ncbi:hypothetical protein GCM10011487_11830 [Steroidobacter agaridevorans]|uniref:Uncharacterized protein n=2 Tax=Steroidobacterales TaxID=3060226 RepID=A0A829Y817_9GAMM|nr:MULTISPECIES: hypothetical protein [Steroidobacteraceae]GFE79183.1 hypothetical protein GCM10011487_11830 [Steroidobacter agaridevorans]
MEDDPTTAALFDALAREQAHFADAPEAFLRAWKQGVELAGVRFFGNGTREDLNRATRKWDLCPNVTLINDAINVLSPGEAIFLASLVSFYDSDDGGRLLRHVGADGLADLGRLDLKRRTVIAGLLLHYTGW